MYIKLLTYYTVTLEISFNKKTLHLSWITTFAIKGHCQRGIAKPMFKNQINKTLDSQHSLRNCTNQKMRGYFQTCSRDKIECIQMIQNILRT